MRLLAGLAVTALVLGACGAATTPSPSPTAAPTTAAPTATPAPTAATEKVVFTADLKTTNEVPPISNAEASCTGKGTFTLNTTKDGTGKVTAATAQFDLTVSACPANIPLTLFHIHRAAAGANGGVVVGGKTDAANPITLATGATASPITVGNVTVAPELATEIIGGPAGFYFNVHSTSNPGGVIRGQLTKG